MSFKPVDAGNGDSAQATRLYNAEIAAGDLNGVIQPSAAVGHWTVRAIHP